MNTNGTKGMKTRLGSLSYELSKLIFKERVRGDCFSSKLNLSSKCCVAIQKELKRVNMCSQVSTEGDLVRILTTLVNLVLSQKSEIDRNEYCEGFEKKVLVNDLQFQSIEDLKNKIDEKMKDLGKYEIALSEFIKKIQEKENNCERIKDELLNEKKIFERTKDQLPNNKKCLIEKLGNLEKKIRDMESQIVRIFEEFEESEKKLGLKKMKEVFSGVIKGCEQVGNCVGIVWNMRKN